MHSSDHFRQYVPISAIVRRRLEARRELSKKAQHGGKVRRAVLGHGFLQEQGRLHGDNLDQSSCQQQPVGTKHSDKVGMDQLEHRFSDNQQLRE